MAAGCIPVWPDRLSYPELVPTEFHADAIYPGGGLRTAMRRALTETDDLHRRLEPLRTAMLRFDWAAVAPQYDDALERLVGLTGGA